MSEVPRAPLAAADMPGWLRESDRGEVLPPQAVRRFGSNRLRLGDTSRSVQLSFTAGGLQARQGLRVTDVLNGNLLADPPLSDYRGLPLGLGMEAATSADGAFVASGCDGPVTVASMSGAHYRWWSPDRSAVGEVPTGAGGLATSQRRSCVAFDEPAQHALVNFGDGALQLFELHGGEVVRDYEDAGCTGHVAMTPSGERFICSTRRGASVFNRAGEHLGSATGEPLGRFYRSTTAVAITDDGRHGAAASEDVVQVFDAETSEVLARFRVRHRMSIDALALSGDGAWVATLTGGRVDVWQSATGRPIPTPPGHHGAVLDVVYLPQSERVISAGVDGRTLVWHAVTGELLDELGPRSEHRSWLRSSPDDEVVGVMTIDSEGQRTLRTYRAASSELLYEGDVTHAEDFALGPAGGYVILSYQRTSEVRSTTNVAVVVEFPPRPGSQRVAIGPNGSVVHGRSSSDAVVALLRPDGRAVALEVPSLPPIPVAVELPRFMGGGQPRQPPTPGIHPVGLGAVAFAANGAFATTARGGGVYLWNGPRLRGCWDVRADALGLHRSGRIVIPRGRGTLAVATAPAAPAQGGRCQRGGWSELHGHTSRVMAVTVVGDEVVSASDDGTLILWRWPTAPTSSAGS